MLSWSESRLCMPTQEDLSSRLQTGKGRKKTTQGPSPASPSPSPAPSPSACSSSLSSLPSAASPLDDAPFGFASAAALKRRRRKRKRNNKRFAMNANRVRIPVFARQMRSVGSKRPVAPLDNGSIEAGKNKLGAAQVERRGLHSVRVSHFKLSDGATSSSGSGGEYLLENQRQVSTESGTGTPVGSEDMMEEIFQTDYADPTRRLKAEFETARLCFKNIPSALKEMTKMDPNGVYANHNLRLDRIRVYGFDYDYTLAHYTPDLQTLIYDLAKEHLVTEHRYPDTCLNFEYDKGFPIRGLYYDKKKGYLLKLDFFHSVEPEGCFFGRRRVSEAELEAAYGGKRISAEHMPNLVALMDLFCLSEVCLITDVIQHFVDEKVEFDASYVYEDVNRSIQFVHKSGLLHRKILEQPSKYLAKSGGWVQLLRNLKEKGKSLFLLTNSPFPFVDGGMRYMFQEDGSSGDSWRELFDVVIALADKPNFYTSERPFRFYNLQKDVLAFSRVEAFQKHSIYYHGCLQNFLQITKWKGPEVLYFGDHLYSDLRGPAKAGWRTAAIIRELEREIRTQNEDRYRFQQAKYHIMQELLGKFHGLPLKNPRGDDEKLLLTSLREERQKARTAMKAMFNPYFGSTFLTDTGKESAFSYNVQRYADVYTSRLENFLLLSLEAWLYTPFDVKILPHHVKVSPSSLLKRAPQPSECSQETHSASS